MRSKLKVAIYKPQDYKNQRQQRKIKISASLDKPQQNFYIATIFVSYSFKINEKYLNYTL